MIIFVDDNDPSDNEVMIVKTLEHIPRIGETIMLEMSRGKVLDIVHDYSNDTDIYIYLDLKRDNDVEIIT